MRNAWLAFNGTNYTDGWILLGDNAYNSGTDAEYQTNFFNIYQGSMTKNHVLWPAPGNHDYANTTARQADHAIPYYDMFTLPKNGEAGGDVTVEGTGAIEVAGARSSGGSGGGGGGSGGGILLRVGGTLTAPGVWLSAPGGAASTGSNNAGGPGGVGRVRVDSAAGPVDSMITMAAKVRGPAWALATPVIATTLSSVTLTGEPGRAFQIRLNDVAAPNATPGIDGTVSITGLPWRRGLNTLCAVARTDRLVAESLACIDVYLTPP